MWGERLTEGHIRPGSLSVLIVAFAYTTLKHYAHMYLSRNDAHTQLPHAVKRGEARRAEARERGSPRASGPRQSHLHHRHVKLSFAKRPSSGSARPGVTATMNGGTDSWMVEPRV